LQFGAGIKKPEKEINLPMEKKRIVRVELSEFSQKSLKTYRVKRGVSLASLVRELRNRKRDKFVYGEKKGRTS
jgi:hypothetical protein